jgi:Dyp-type peroxidase family
MAHSFVNIVAPIAQNDVVPLRRQIGELLGNPANEMVEKALDPKSGIHFASMHALEGSDGVRGHLLFEMTCDGESDASIAYLAARLTEPLTALFSHANDWREGNDLANYLQRHSVRGGFGLFDPPGVDFAGTPGMSVARIREESELRRHVEELLAELLRDIRPITQLRAARDSLQASSAWSWAVQPPDAFDSSGTTGHFGLARILRVGMAFVKTYLWPFLLVLALIAGVAAMQQRGVMPALCTGWTFLWRGLLLIGGVALGSLALLYWRLRVAEERDWISDRMISRVELAEILKRENRHLQNHMISHTVRKPGLMRLCVQKLALFAIGTITPLNGRPGYLDKIGTIHFARWITIPGTRDYIFLSNFDGSWESYLEDFITQAHQGLTAAWSCNMGFPKTKNLFQDGATDGERFKRFARHSMTHTAFWYSAYPQISTDQIRSNARIRRGLALAETDEEAIAWLSLFGSIIRPSEKLESSQIQSLIFGGLSNLPHGKLLLLSLADDRKAAKAMMTALMPHIAYNDGRKIEAPAVLTLAIGPSALVKLGLPSSAIESFPAAFLDGMTAPGRERILGDCGAEERPQKWWWKHSHFDLALLIYAETGPDLAALEKSIRTAAKAGLHQVLHEVPLETVTSDRSEAFGFFDGVSQPLIKGTYKATREPDGVNLVNPGEFILGYPDNRGNMPPAPRLSAALDPKRRLPIGQGGWNFDAGIGSDHRDIGRNGSYLVIRQLEQHVEAFDSFCKQAATDYADSFQAPFVPNAELIGAKMVGRWKDGSALVRWPYESETTYRSRVSGGAKGYANPENDFLFGTEDPQALRCPFGSHIRRTNPRESLLPSSVDQIAISNRHRILRVGRKFEAQGDRDPGLLFMCFNGDIERQFEFVQQTWANSSHFHSLDQERDPLLSENGEGSRYTIPTRSGPILLKNLPNFVTMRGGGYFFAPGNRFIEYLAKD